MLHQTLHEGKTYEHIRKEDMTNTKAPRRRRATNSNATFLSVALRPYRRGEPEDHIVINTRTIRQVTPPMVITCTKYSKGTEVTTHEMVEPRYGVSFKEDKVLQQGRVWGHDLVAAGIRRHGSGDQDYGQGFCHGRIICHWPCEGDSGGKYVL